MKLYEINKAIEEVYEGLIDPETGELSDEAAARLEDLEMARYEKVENIACLIKNIDSDVKAIREEEVALAKRRKACENHSEGLKKYLMYCLNGEKFSSPRAQVSFRKGTKVEVGSATELPEEFLRYKDPEPDKKAISEALKAGREVPGCALVESLSMTVK